MSKEGSVAPKERVNITYKPAAGEVQQQVELPFKVLMLGEFMGRPDERPIEERSPISVDKDNFNQVMAEQKLAVEATVPNRLSSDPNAEMHVNLQMKGLSDFTPDGIAGQVPELQKLLELRQALIALKGPLGNVPAFRKKIQTLLEDPGARERIMKELGLGTS